MKSGRAKYGLLAGLLFLLGLQPGTYGFEITINTPAGPVSVELSHAGPDGELVTPGAPDALPFRPPSIFSAPLPSGSGARALGVAGAFTAIADDATAASWNPAGLIQLERPEASVMYRYDRETDKHRSSNADLIVGRDEFDNHNLNYLSVVVPFYILPVKRNAVFSLNYQEAYDFTTRFTARLDQSARERMSQSTAESFFERQVFNQTLVERLPQGTNTVVVSIAADVATEVNGQSDQTFGADTLTSLEYDQKGIVEAISPAFAVELTPRLFVGGTFNYYQNSALDARGIRSHTLATYSGRTTRSSRNTTQRSSSGQYSYSGTNFVDSGFGFLIPIGFSGGPESFSFSNTEMTYRSDSVEFDGEYEEFSEMDDFRGYNATLGFMYAASRFLTLAGAVDLPWTAKAEQTKRVRTRVTTYNDSRSRVLDVFESNRVDVKDIELVFPMYWALGAAMHWTPYFYTSLDISRTEWSEFSFKAAGEPRINPLDGSLHSENPLKDTWAVRGGMEYLKVGRRSEIPFRLGGAWEQRPALGSPDDFYSISTGTGIAFGEENEKVIIDLAYIYTFADDVRGIIPEEPGLSSDVEQHQGFVSVIRHF